MKRVIWLVTALYVIKLTTNGHGGWLFYPVWGQGKNNFCWIRCHTCEGLSSNLLDIVHLHGGDLVSEW